MLMLLLLLLLLVMVGLRVWVLVVLLRCFPRRFQSHHARCVRRIDCGRGVGNRSRH